MFPNQSGTAKLPVTGIATAPGATHSNPKADKFNKKKHAYNASKTGLRAAAGAPALGRGTQNPMVTTTPGGNF